MSILDMTIVFPAETKVKIVELYNNETVYNGIIEEIPDSLLDEEVESANIIIGRLIIEYSIDNNDE